MECWHKVNANFNSIWKIREDVSVLADQANFDQTFDISLPIPVIGKEVDHAIDQLEQLDFVEKIFPLVMWPMVISTSSLEKKRILLKSLNQLVPLYTPTWKKIRDPYRLNTALV